MKHLLILLTLLLSSEVYASAKQQDSCRDWYWPLANGNQIPVRISSCDTTDELYTEGLSLRGQNLSGRDIYFCVNLALASGMEQMLCRQLFADEKFFSMDCRDCFTRIESMTLTDFSYPSRTNNPSDNLLVSPIAATLKRDEVIAESKEESGLVGKWHLTGKLSASRVDLASNFDAQMAMKLPNGKTLEFEGHWQLDGNLLTMTFLDSEGVEGVHISMPLEAPQIDPNDEQSPLAPRVARIYSESLEQEKYLGMNEFYARGRLLNQETVLMVRK
ncbi:hypothetical protein [Biformimicrobium ophioploci]|uniref:Uncharacterized protein n=1 Tax=Biformimicrobium ophioploci TaxID=3036711 RepID=A0ABQ6LXM5_9GAMM|nr:hypothetical protein [Microbulbifer sp. NKW57]GMG86830.1 hypothetical protein MNKW57_11510 [Microbulbifer sp. NKW57]